MRELLANKSKFVAQLNYLLLRRVAGVVVLGERLRSIFDGYVAQCNMRVVKNFAADSIFIDEVLLNCKWRNQGTYKLLYLSNFLPGKGYKDLCAAIKSIPSELSSRFIFDFAGGFESKAEEAEFKTLISEITSIRYHGIVEGDVKNKLLHEAHFFCLPTYYPYEGQPISILEAYAAGCVVLTTDHSGIFDIFQPGLNGLEVMPRQPLTIVAALEKLVSDYAAAEEIARHNRADASIHYTRKIHLASLYEALGLSVSK
jgi:glycosyltransferase involved in cell wall biosynthesis